MAGAHSKSIFDAMHVEPPRDKSRSLSTSFEKPERDPADKVLRGASAEKVEAPLPERLPGDPRPEEKSTPLEEALEDLRSRESTYRWITRLIEIILFVAFAASAFFGNFKMALTVWFLFFLTFATLTISGNRLTTSWEYSEEFAMEGAGAYLEDVASLAPRIFQSISLQEASLSREGNRLVLRMKLEKSVAQHSRGGSKPLSIRLGEFVIEAEFLRRNGDVLVRAQYKGEPPLGYAATAADVYESLVVAFRSSVWEAFERAKPKVSVKVDFAEIARLIASSGLVVTAVRCPHCGANIELPKEGDTTKCPYCGTTVKAIDVYKLVKELIKQG